MLLGRLFHYLDVQQARGPSSNCCLPVMLECKPWPNVTSNLCLRELDKPMVSKDDLYVRDLPDRGVTQETSRILEFNSADHERAKGMARRG